MAIALAPPYRQQPNRATRRAGVAAAIVGLHAVAAYLLASPGLWRVWPVQAPSVTLTWLVLSQPKPEEPETKSVAAPPAPSARKSAPPTLAPIPRPSISAPPLPAPDQGVAALRSYVWCGALDDGKPWNVQQRPCDKVQWDLQTGPLAARAPTEREKELTRQFQRDLAFDKAPKLIPCVNGAINFICLAQGVMNGFEFKMASYGDIKSPSTTCASRFDGEHCARIYSLQSTAPTALRR